MEEVGVREMEGYIKCDQCKKPIEDSHLILDRTNGLAFHYDGKLDLSQQIPPTGSECVDRYLNTLRHQIKKLPTENVRDIEVIQPKRSGIFRIGSGLQYALSRVAQELGLADACGHYLHGGDAMIHHFNEIGRIYIAPNKAESTLIPLFGVYNFMEFENEDKKRVAVFTDLPSGKKLKDIPERLTDLVEAMI